MNRPTSPQDDPLLVNRIQRFCLHDGPGIRTTVFLQGCPLRCWWCQNPDTIPRTSTAARRMTAETLVAACVSDARYWRESGGGVTISGGEGLLQAEALAVFLERMGREEHHRAVETSGAVGRGQVIALSPHVDLWLWDLKAVSPDRFREHTGGDVARSLDDLAWVLSETDDEVVLRVPLVNSFNTDEDELQRMADTVEQLSRPVAVEILPGHELGCDIPAGRPSPCATDVQIRRAEDIFKGRAAQVMVRW